MPDVFKIFLLRGSTWIFLLLLYIHIILLYIYYIVIVAT